MDYIEQVENTRWAIAVMTAYYAEEGTALASQVASEYVNEPNGVERLIDGFIHLSARMLLTFEAAGVPAMRRSKRSQSSSTPRRATTASTRLPGSSLAGVLQSDRQGGDAQSQLAVQVQGVAGVKPDALPDRMVGIQIDIYEAACQLYGHVTRECVHGGG